MNEENFKPLQDKDLLGLVDVVLKKPPIRSRSKSDTLVFIVEFEGKEHRIGVIGKEAYEAIKEHGYKDATGVIHFRIPKTALRDEGCGWINTPY